MQEYFILDERAAVVASNLQLATGNQPTNQPALCGSNSNANKTTTTATTTTFDLNFKLNAF